ncbi:MAG: archease [Thermoprotei archaeon]|nr:archease [Thermoprotei archaeon]
MSRWELLECKAGFEHLEHTADVLIEAKGRSLSEAFEYAALATYEVMTDTGRVEPKVRVEVKVEGVDILNTLYRWIEELIAYTDSSRLVFSKFKVHKIEIGHDNVRLEAEAWGEYFDPERHPSRTVVKAMTYAQMEMKEEGGCWTVKFVVDI